MNNLLKIIAPVIFLTLCSACDKQPVAQDVKPETPVDDDRLNLFELFNPFYLDPDLDQLCIIDTQFLPMEEQEFEDVIDRIAADIGIGVAYSNPVRRNRIVYGAPQSCDDFEQNGAYSPAQYFDHITSVSTTNANEHPHAVETFDYTKELVADLENAAIAANFDLGPFVSKEVLDKQADEIVCVLNNSTLAKNRYGLPFTYIHIYDDAILYVYNAPSIDESLVPFLVERGLEECEANYAYEFRPLNDEQARNLKKITIKTPYTYRFE